MYNKTIRSVLSAVLATIMLFCSVPVQFSALDHDFSEAAIENIIDVTIDEDCSCDMPACRTVCGEDLLKETLVFSSLTAEFADYTELNALVAEAEAIDRTAYTEESLSALDAVLEKITYDMKFAQQSIVDGWADELQKALTDLICDFLKATIKITTILDKKEVAEGDIVTVKVKLDANYYVTGMQLPILYDKTQFEIVGASADSSYLTFYNDSALVKASYDTGGSTIKNDGFKYTSDSAIWDTDEMRAKYAYAWITASPRMSANNFKLVMPKGDIFVSFQVKALTDVEDATQSIFISPDWTKTATVQKGSLTVGFSASNSERDAFKYISTGMNYIIETIAIEGVNITGTVTSCDNNIVANDDNVTMELFAEKSDVADYTMTVAGSGSQIYAFKAVKAGEYILRVSKPNHVTREFSVTIGDETVNLDVQINLLGDINGDGRISLLDCTSILKHVKKTSELEGYALDCADVDTNGRVMLIDYTAVLKHVKKTSSLW